MSCCLIVPLAMASLLTATDAKDDPKNLDGAWALVSADFGGAKFPDELVKNTKLVIKDGQYTVTIGKQTDRGTIKVDASKSPRQMDVIGVEGPNKGKTFPAIFELDGDGLKICYDLEGKERPTEFAAKPKSQQFLAVYKRVKE